MTIRIYGHIPGYPEGSEFESRADLSYAGVHRPRMAGICGSGREATESIVLSSGYEDDEDFDDEIIYTGHGGRDSETGKQITHQTLTKGNLALAYNKLTGLPVRVIRGARLPSPYAPPVGYRYDGLYQVEDYWHKRGRSGFDVWLYRLHKVNDQNAAANTIAEEPAEYVAAPRQAITVLRVVRDTEQARQVKALYHYHCQICSVRLEGSAGPYAEAAHIRPLGRPHNGPDTPDNILCLCPNHHVLFDYGGVAIADDFSLLGEEGHLFVDPRHSISKEHLRYHREHRYVTP
jgi:putative restriction endonuclease